ncbi:MAG: hypothetical protein HC836_14190 [Richelia sp. RM2_1_2]|nr:hypothetical protein [Leptolyngbyaceae cyanobacterium SM1_4_3]NJN06622.1 hypothetical protein [Richelia sp. RM1_1_1]NJO27176.1 hypothetical protein [Richelia sp. SL_2_1]NJO59407.1 hypothetical protein [Richelia sp. RM2_1_2]
MITNNFQEISSETYIGVPVTADIPTPQVGQAPTYYDCLALLPAILTALTPLILGLKKKDKDDDDKE